MLIKKVELINPKDLLGKGIRIFLKDGGKFNFKVVGCGDKLIWGYDDEQLQLTIDLEDIDYIVG